LILLHLDDDPDEIAGKVREVKPTIASAHLVVVTPETGRLDASSGVEDAALAEVLARYTCSRLEGLVTTSRIASRSEYAAMRRSGRVAIVSRSIVALPFSGRQAHQCRALARRLGMRVVPPNPRPVQTMTQDTVIADNPIGEVSTEAVHHEIDLNLRPSSCFDAGSGGSSDHAHADTTRATDLPAARPSNAGQAPRPDPFAGRPDRQGGLAVH